jgi:hypothetical protein
MLYLVESLMYVLEETVAAAPKPKRRAYLLKRKALTTGFFDSGRKEDKDKGTCYYLFYFRF